MAKLKAFILSILLLITTVSTIEEDTFYTQVQQLIDWKLKNRLEIKNDTKSSLTTNSETPKYNHSTISKNSSRNNDFEDVIFTAQVKKNKKKKMPKWTFTAGIFADKKQEQEKEEDCDKNVKFITTPVTVINPAEEAIVEEDEVEEESPVNSRKKTNSKTKAKSTPRPKPKPKPKRPSIPTRGKPKFPYWMFDSSSDDISDDSLSDWTWSESDSSSDDDEYDKKLKRKNGGKFWFLNINSTELMKENRVSIIPDQLLVTKVSPNFPNLLMDQRNEFAKQGNGSHATWLRKDEISTNEDFESSSDKESNLVSNHDKRGRFLNKKYSKLKSTKFYDGGKKFAKDKYYWRSDYMKEKAEYLKQKQKFKEQEAKFRELENEIVDNVPEDDEPDSDSENDSENDKENDKEKRTTNFETRHKTFSASITSQNFTKMAFDQESKGFKQLCIFGLYCIL
ncbi:uncharacterized protein KGF55_001698 [Candida pseudojiufengensis]|uniref:uncharacterized protein n=1 Tax=Candida pseudojiufengensis TaxID=497109 RepID=UPI00222517E3|nr:uncharacterized protein KGF55_001698 [Candida pseudojiufengensis]KAI5964629.1 hypothetical protein KGF55_001698 [Candida pseudojiufengensis]